MQFKQMFVTAVCVLFLLKLKWPKSKIFFEPNKNVSENFFFQSIFSMRAIFVQKNSHFSYTIWFERVIRTLAFRSRD